MKFLDKIYRPDAKYGPFLATLLLSGIGYGLYRGIQDNYLAEIVHISKFERGLVEFFRETPGLLVMLILAAMYRLSESRIFKIGVAIMLAGLVGLLLCLPGKVSVVIFMVVFSFGEHIVMPVKATIAMSLARETKGGAALGVSGSLSQLGNIAGFLIVAAIFAVFSLLGRREIGDSSAYKAAFALAAALMLAAALVSLAIRETEVKVARRRFYFAKKFFKFYMLEVFYGARKQVFLTFAPYVLILQYGADTSLISILLAVCAIFGALLSPLIGRLIDRVGYRIVMISDTLILVLVCFLYGYAHRLFPANIAFIVVCVNYVLDSIVSLASMASNIYVKDIASSQEEVTATLSTGISVNHVISIFIALAGGWIWSRIGVEALFTISAILGLCNSFYAATIRVPGNG
jgi:MFS family permease